MSRRFQFSMPRVKYGTWLLRVVAWDGLLPLGIAVVPHIVEELFPNQRGIMEVTAVTLPIAAFWFRVRNGKTQVASNQCSMAIRRVQYAAFVIGILPLVMIDCVLILSHLTPPGAAFQARSDQLVWAVLVGTYLAAMIVAMYPGQVGSPAAQHSV